MSGIEEAAGWVELAAKKDYYRHIAGKLTKVRGVGEGSSEPTRANIAEGLSKMSDDQLATATKMVSQALGKTPPGDIRRCTSFCMGR